MKTIIAMGGVAAAALSSAQAGDLYLQIHAGGFQQTEDTIALGAEGMLGEIAGEFDADAELGAAVGGLVGFYVLPYVGIEGEVTVRASNFDTIEGAEVDDSLRSVALMANVAFRPELPLFPIKPYVAVGAGYLTTDLEDFDGDDVDGQLAYQVKAGFNFDLLPTPGMLGAEVSYLATDDFDVSSATIDGLTDAEFGYSGITALLTWKIKL